MRQFLGEAILEALYDDDIEEIYVNPDMVVRQVSHTRGRIETADRAQPSPPHYSHFELDNGACLAFLARIMRRSTAYVDGGFSVDRRGGFLAFAMGAALTTCGCVLTGSV